VLTDRRTSGRPYELIPCIAVAPTYCQCKCAAHLCLLCCRSFIHGEPPSHVSPTSSPRSRSDVLPDLTQHKTERVTAASHSKQKQVHGTGVVGGHRQAQYAKGRSVSDESTAETTTSRKVRTVVYDDDDYEEDLNKSSTKRNYSTVYTAAAPVSPQVG